MKHALYNLWTLLLALSCADAARILCIVPTPSISHQLPLRFIVKALVARGHQVTFLTSDPTKIISENYTEIDLSSSYDYIRQFDFSSIGQEAPIEFVNTFMHQYAAGLVEQQFSLPAVKKLINSGQQFDLMILETICYDAYYGLLHKVGSPPLVGFISLNLMTPTYSYVGNPNNPAYSTDQLLPYTDHMNFWQRMYSTYFYLRYHYVWNTKILPDQEMVLRKFFGDEPPSIYETQRNFSLMLINNHWSMNYPKPYLPSLIPLTGLHIDTERKPLPQDIGKFLDGATEGAIYISFGTNIRWSSLSPEFLQSVVEAFAELPQRILWKCDLESIPQKPSNVMTAKWFSQQDVLAHPKVKLFVTQGGMQSLNEASYYGVPMVAVPFFCDQAHNSVKMESSGVAVVLNVKDVTKDTFLHAIRTVLHNASYHEAMESFSAVYRDEPKLSLERAVWWLEYVLRHKGAPHLRSAALDLHWTQALMLDVLAVFLAALLGIVLLTWKAARLCFASVQRRKIKRS